MRVLVTGATGFLRGHVARAFAAADCAVTATGRNVGIGRAMAAAGIRFERMELADAIGIDRLVSGADIVIHAAGLSSAWGPPASFHAANVIGTRNVVRACRRNGVPRLVHISTPSLYFDFTDRLDIREDAPLATVPVNAYAAESDGRRTVIPRESGQ